MRVLLHICCGPCAIAPAEQLREQGHAVSGFFFNPNIHPLSEYLRRREAAQEAALRLDIPMEFQDGYDPLAWLDALGSARSNGPKDPNPRCAVCYSTRLAATAEYAAEHHFDAFTSSLLYSRFQLHDRIKALGAEAGQRTGVPFLYENFRTGWQHGIDRSKEWNLFRQNYCGCILSEQERFARALEKAVAATTTAR